jgi:MYND finger
MTEKPERQVCGACGISQAKSCFSGSQWKKRSHRRCLGCIESDNPLLNPSPETKMVLPGKKPFLFCSPELAKDLQMEQDETGNWVVDLEKVLASPRDICGNQPCCQKARKLCTRCKCIQYCSKECQVADWKRHKKAECIPKPKHEPKTVWVHPSDHDQLHKATDNATEKCWKAAKQAHENKMAGTDTWAKDLMALGLGKPGKPPFEPKIDEACRNFTIQYYVQLASFAAYHIAKYPHLKGCLFLFTKASIFDLFRIQDEEQHSPLDRMFLLAWGYLPPAGMDPENTNTPMFSLDDLRTDFIRVQCPSLTRMVELACHSQSFPLVICADPTGQHIPDPLNASLRHVQGVDLMDYQRESPQAAVSTTVRFFDFNAMVEAGNAMPETEISGYNLDRSYGEPTMDDFTAISIEQVD